MQFEADTLQAAVLNVKLKRTNILPRGKKQRFIIIKHSRHPRLLPFVAPYTDHVFHQYTLILNDVNRDGCISAPAAQVPSMIYYPVPAHRQRMFEAFGGGAYRLPQTDWLAERVISLPIHTN